jgi:hypothetical protein
MQAAAAETATKSLRDGTMGSDPRAATAPAVEHRSRV